MVRQEDWAVSAHRIAAFFSQQSDVTAEGRGFRCGDCRIDLTPMNRVKPWPMERTLLRLEGPEEQVQALYRRFFLRFLSAGG